MDEQIALSLKNITKQYPGVLALDRVSLDFVQGEVHALLGENGAGKSTLIKVIAGAIEPDAGVIQIGAQQYTQMNPHLARSLGVEVIYQEFNLAPSLSVAENIFLGDKTGRGILIDKKVMVQRAREVFKQFAIDIDPHALVRDLPSAQQQIVEIAKAVSKNVRILIMDEPTAPLTVSEVDSMFEIVRQLKARGVTILYISHRLEEIFRIADKVSVLRDGRYIATRATAATNRKELISLMVGRELKESYPARTVAPREVALEVRHLSGNGDEDISFSVRKGEILGLSGLVGAGRTELARVIFGAEPAESGEILLEGRPVQIRSPQDAINLGIGLIPEDRKHQGVFLDMDIKWNISFTQVRQLSRYAVVDGRRETTLAEKFRNLLRIKTPSLEQQVKNLSGGNQQKVVLAKSLAAQSKVLIFDEPTRGIDVGAKQEIYNLMCALADDGLAIIMISSDMEELLGMADRILVLCEGRIAGEVPRAQFNQNLILDLASGKH
ncbi:MAG TPA: D-xylose ABC transporter ATP-binding protein [Chloroflexi bacterium]|nr:D-xylose ABC transporter ATP-binding protein [Chloroflexota bacterium]